MKKNIVFRVATLLAVLALFFGAAGALPVQAAPAAMAQEAPVSRSAQALNNAGEGQPALPIGFYATAVTAGGSHTCGLTVSGGVKCWGDNGYGQLGDGNSLTFSATPVQVSGLASAVSAIAAGESHTCVLTASGGVRCWGNNGSGQLGNNTTVASYVPVQVSGLESGVSAIAASENHTCVLMTAGGVQCWGFNLYGQLGDGSTTNRTVPVPVSGLASAVRAISVGGNNTCVLTTSGVVKCWGSNDVGQLGNGTTSDSALPVPVNGLASGVSAIAVGVNHTCVLPTTGGVKCWGDNGSGQLGDGTTEASHVPVLVSGLASDIISAIALGYNHTCVLTNMGEMKCWGANSFGQLGNDAIDNNSLTPTPVSGLANGLSAIAAGAFHTCALTTSGEVKCWGNNTMGQLGNGTKSNSPFPTPAGVVGLAGGVSAISLGGLNSCALTSAGGVKCWGANYFGQLGNIDLGSQYTSGDSTPVDVLVASGGPALSGVSAISVGDIHACALMATAGVKCWGYNASKQLGLDPTVIPFSALPVDISGLTGDVSAISAGGFHTCALITTGAVQCWGDNSQGQLGDDSSGTNRATPVTVLDATGESVLSSISAISAGGSHTCALTTTGGVVCWGINSDGQLGDGTRNNSNIPVTVLNGTGAAALSGVLAISSGVAHTCALMTTGETKCWGDNAYGQLGNGTQTDSALPVDVLDSLEGPALNGVSAIVAGEEHTCVLTSAGGSKCWGDNAYGQLGDGTKTGSATPVNVLVVPEGSALSGLSAISAGGFHTCVLTAAGGAQCWGFNDNGQLGDSSFTGSTTPVKVSGLLSSTLPTLTLDPQPAIYGQAVSLIARVTSVAQVPSGLVHFAIDGVSGPPVVLLDGSATSPDITDLALGAHLVQASYSGDDNYFASVSAGLVQIVRPAAATLTTVAASDKTASGAKLHGSVSGGSVSTTVTFEYGLSTAYGSSVAAAESPLAGDPDTDVSAVLTGLTANTTYHYRVVADNGGGLVNGGDMDFTTPFAAPTATTRAATGVSASIATLNGLVNPNGSSTDVTFEYGTTASYGSTAPATTGTLNGDSTATDVSAALTGLTPSTPYHFRVVAVNSGGTTNSADRTFTTLVAPTATTSAATGVSATSASLRGLVNANGSNTTVTFLYGLTTGYGSTASAGGTLTGVSATAVSAALSGLTPSTIYHFQVKAVSDGGTSYGEDMDFTTPLAPPTATTSAAAGVGASTATLNGLVNAKGNSTDITFEYGPTASYGKTTDATPATLSDSTATAVSAALTGLTSSTTYHFRVKAVSDGGTTNGADLTFTTSASAPTATTSAATGVSATTATLKGLVNANGSSTAVSFEYGTTTSYGKIIAASPTPLIDRKDILIGAALSGLTPKTIYHFRVKAVNGGGTVYGSDMTFTTIAIPTATTSPVSVFGATTATLKGLVNANGSSTAVIFQYGSTTSYGKTIAATPGTLTTRTLTPVSAALTGLIPSTTYHLQVKAVNSVGITYGGDMTFTTVASAPTATTSAATNVSASTASLHGSVTANGRPTMVFFEYGPTASYGLIQPAIPNYLIGSTTTAVSLGLAGLPPNSTYHFRVKAVNGLGTTYSADMTFTTAAIAPAVTTGAAYGIGTTAASLRGVANANNSISTITFEYGLTPSYGSTAAATPGTLTNRTATAVIAVIGDLLPNKFYHFRVKAVNSAGTTTGHDMIFLTLPMAERIVNGGFEIYSSSIAKIPASWAAANFSSRDGRDVTVKKLGQSSLMIGGESSKTKILTQAIALIGMPNTAFMLSFWARGSNIPEAGLCKLDVMIYSNATLLVTKTLACKTGTYSTFTQASLPTFKTSTAFNRLVIRITYTKSSGIIWLDGVSLMK